MLDFSPICEGGDSTDALESTIRLAQLAEALGFSRYWLGEHHVAGGVAGVAPHSLAPIIAARTKTIRIGTAASIVPHYFPAQILEFAGVFSSLFPRLDLGLARGHVVAAAQRTSASANPPIADRILEGLVFPAPAAPLPHGPDYVHPLLSGVVQMRPEVNFEVEVRGILDLASKHAGGQIVEPGLPFHFPGLTLWLHGTNPGASPRLAGGLGLPYSANYHFSGSRLLENLADYRKSFVPSAALQHPHVVVSADVIVAPSDQEAEGIRATYARRTLDLKSGRGLTPLASGETLRSFHWSDADRLAVRDKLQTQIVGTADHVVDRLQALVRIANADELLITSVAHRYEDRARSYELLAEAWVARPADL
ncbi:LLM class flavin-dependent oxidoreductase [Paenirhodobacter populi]|uniref:LLM class flavin-dependent oxidoreductase n=1 Tax=Paenirhodobacter populi TaxID=2306993 RepID=UPI0013E3A7BF|nr:LLM class flavin-dependent oxidoreductase [Sinirhodobacter populi]